MKRISIFIPTLCAGGAEKQAAILASLLSDKFEVKLIVFRGEVGIDPRNAEYLKNSAVNTVLLIGSFRSRLRSLSENLKQTDILFNYLTFCDFVGGLVARHHKVDKIYSGIRNSELPFWKVILERIGARAASKVIFNSYFGQKELGDRISGKEKQVVIPNCLPSNSEFQPRPDKEVKNIITVARFVPQKDFDTALKSIKQLSESRSDFIYTIVGYGELESRIRQKITELNLENCVNLAIKPDNVADYLKNADIYLSTSIFEGTSNSLMEAMDAGLPIVTTDAGDAPYFITKENGLTVKPGDCGSITKNLSFLLSSAELRNRLGKCSNETAGTLFSTPVFLENYLKLTNI